MAAAGLAPAAAMGRRPCGLIKASFALDFVLRLDLVIGAERDHVGALFCVVGNAAPVERGQAVTQGQVIGYVGSTGNSTGNHCHFEMQYNGALFSAYTLFSGM